MTGSLGRRVALGVMLALALAAPIAGGQVEGPAAAESAAAPAVVEESPQPVGSGLPVRAPLPRTMEAYWPVFALFAATWLAIAGYLLVTGRRSAQLSARLRAWEERR